MGQIIGKSMCHTVMFNINMQRDKSKFHRCNFRWIVKQSNVIPELRGPTDQRSGNP